MKIYFTPAVKSYTNNRQQNKHEPNKRLTKDYSYNPAAYRDFNISFGARLFRTPENFYEQDFNKDGMPKSLHRYIYNPDNHNFRKTIPPAQAMKEVFGSISDMQSLEEVKAAFPDEPLFSDLHSQSSRKARIGLLGELALLRSDEDYANKSLFKNGKDDLGMYILKKIYVEGKTLKEINKDFQRDKSVVYNGLSDIQYTDIKAFGIKFPKQDFWKSFIATREDFPYVYIPRTVEGVRKTSNSPVVKNVENTVKPQTKKRFEDIKDWEIDKISDALLEGMGDQKETEKLLKKRNLKDTESLNFVAKYMGEINSVVLEKLHVSEEMKEFFDNYENLSKSQKQKFKDYWKSPETKELRSIVMSSTIRFFFDVYGVDGNNEEFQELLEYARGIKAKREAQELEHNRKQAEYDELFRDLGIVGSPEKSELQEEMQPVEKPKVFADELRKQADLYNGKVYDFMVDNGITVSIVANLPEIMSQKYHSEYRFLPKTYADKYTKFVLEHPKVTEDYMLSLLYKVDNLLDKGEMIANKQLFDDPAENEDANRKIVSQVKSQLMSVRDVNAVKEEVDKDFLNKNKKLSDIATQTLMELSVKLMGPNGENFKNKISKELMQILDGEKEISFDNLADIFDSETQNAIHSDLLKKANLLKKHDIAFLDPGQIVRIFDVCGFNELSAEQKQFVEKTFDKYQQPLSNKEIKKITYKIIDNMVNYDTNGSSVLDEPYVFLYRAAQKNIYKYPQIKASLTQILQKMYVQPQNTTLRYFIDENADPKLIAAKTERLIVDILTNEPELFSLMSSIDLENMDKYIKPFDFAMYRKMCEYRLVAAAFFDNALKK